MAEKNWMKRALGSNLKRAQKHRVRASWDNGPPVTVSKDAANSGRMRCRVMDICSRALRRFSQATAQREGTI